MSTFSTVCSEKWPPVGAVSATTLIDVCLDEEFAADPRLLASTVRCTAAQLRFCNIAVESLQGGHRGRKQAELRTIAAENPEFDGRGRAIVAQLDHSACFWLIRRFADPAAVFLYVSAAEIEEVAEPFGPNDEVEKLNAGILLNEELCGWCCIAT